MSEYNSRLSYFENNKNKNISERNSLTISLSVFHVKLFYRVDRYPEVTKESSVTKNP